jgi:hypothetical protein
LAVAELFFLREGFDGTQTAEGFAGTSPLDWHNKDAAMYVRELMSQYGMPSSVDPTSGGIVIFKKDKLMNTPFDRIEVRDESIPQAYPFPHNAFVYVFVNYDVAPSKFLEVTSISGSISYDPLKKQLRARCGNIGACIATLALCTQIGEGHISLSYAQSNELYPQYILASQDADQLNRLHDLLAYNLKHQQGNPNSSGFWPLAVQANMPMPSNLYP